MFRVGRRLRERNVEVGLPAAFAGICLLFAATGANFATTSNALNISRQSVALVLLSAGLAVAMIGGGIDLSVGANMSVASVVSALIAQRYGVMIGYSAALLTGGVIGLVNGALIAGFGIPPFIATLATLSVGGGSALLLSDGLPIGGLPSSYSWLGTSDFAGVPVASLLSVVVVALLATMMRYTRFGRHVYAVGGGARAAWLAGVNVRGVQCRMYVISGVLASAASIALSSRIASGQPTLGDPSRMIDAVAAVLIGGVALGGGSGSVARVAGAAVFLSVLSNGMNLSGIQSFWQDVVKGIVIVTAALSDAHRASGASFGRFLLGALRPDRQPNRW